MNIQRHKLVREWTSDGMSVGMESSDKGDWVTFDDHEAAIATARAEGRRNGIKELMALVNYWGKFALEQKATHWDVAHKDKEDAP